MSTSVLRIAAMTAAALALTVPSLLLRAGAKERNGSGTHRAKPLKYETIKTKTKKV